MSGRGFKETLEVVTSITVIAGVLLLSGFVVYRSLNHPAESAQVPPAVGAALPALPGYNWGQHSKTLLLVIRKGCHFCEDSLPFYRELLQAERNGDSKVFLISVLPDGEIDATHMLQDAQLDVPVVASFPLQQLHISATPTVVLVDRNGRVEHAWVGEQQAAGRKAILAAIRN